MILEAERPRPGLGLWAGLGSDESPLLVCNWTSSHCVLTWQRETNTERQRDSERWRERRKLSGFSPYKVANFIMNTATPPTLLPPKPSPPNTFTGMLGLHLWIWGDAFQSMAHIHQPFTLALSVCDRGKEGHRRLFMYLYFVIISTYISSYCK